jgi:hypothetical protein
MVIVATYDQAGAGRRKLPGANESGDLVGFSLAAGDFNGDGISDLAVGAPGEDLAESGAVDAGVVFVGHGERETGLNFQRPGSAYRQDGSVMFDLPGAAGSFHAVGFSLAAGSFDGDGFTDLAIGLPGRRTSSLRDAGAVVVVEGTASGLHGQSPSHSLYHNEFWQGGSGTWLLPGRLEGGDLVGFSLAAGDFDGDGFDDLAAGAPGEDIRIDGHTYPNAGAVMAMRGGGHGLDAIPYAEPLHASGNGRYDLRGTAQTGALVGFALAAGDFDGDTHADLAIGVPGRTVDGAPRAGAVAVARGVDAVNGGPGLDGTWYRAEFTQSAANAAYDLPSSAWRDAMVGYSLAAGDFDAGSESTSDDLAIGVPGHEAIVAPGATPPVVRLVPYAGAVAVRFGSMSDGLASAKAPLLLQQTARAEWDLGGSSERGDLLGSGIAAGRLGRDTPADLVISAPGELVDNPSVTGAPPAWSQMLVDGYTHVVTGSPGVGPDAATGETAHWYMRFRRGLHVWGVGEMMNELTHDAAERLSGDHFFNGWNATDLKLDPSGEVDYIEGDAVLAGDNGGGDRARAQFWLGLLDGRVLAQVWLTWRDDPAVGEHAAGWFPRGVVFDAAQKVVLLPRLLVEIVIEP